MAIQPISVAVTRGGLVEAVHRVHAVAVDRSGAHVLAAGDPDLVTFFRSSAKPLQALPLARERPDIGDRELAVACASHLADPEQLSAARALLAAVPAREDDLECGPAGDPPERIKNNCSGKHAAMLALCRSHDWDTAGYRLADHPCQRTLLAEVAAAADVAADRIPTTVDGCGVLTFALPLDRMALAFARLRQLDGGTRIAAAMRTYPEIVRGPRAPDTQVMLMLRGWVAKGGAEGLFCAASADGLGVALKVADGASRAVGPAVAAVLGDLGYDLPRLRSSPVHNTRGEPVGEITVQPPNVKQRADRRRARRRPRE